MNFKDSSILLLERKYPRIVDISKGMIDNESKHYNPTHLGNWNNVCKSIHPAGELTKIIIQLFLDKVDINKCKKLKSLSENEWKSLGEECKKYSNICKKYETDILSLFQKLDLEKTLMKYYE